MENLTKAEELKQYTDRLKAENDRFAEIDKQRDINIAREKLHGRTVYCLSSSGFSSSLCFLPLCTILFLDYANSI